MGIFYRFTGAKSASKYAIEPTREMFAEMDSKDREASVMLEARMRESGLFQEDRISGMLEQMKRGGLAAAFDGEELLSVAEKKASGINPRIRVSRGYFECLTENGRRADNPKDLLSNMYHDVFHRIERKYLLMNLRRAGFAKVKLLPVGDRRDCKAAIGRRGNIFRIDSAPSLPLPECDAPYCRCTFAPKS